MSVLGKKQPKRISQLFLSFQETALAKKVRGGGRISLNYSVYVGGGHCLKITGRSSAREEEGPINSYHTNRARPVKRQHKLGREWELQEGEVSEGAGGWSGAPRGPWGSQHRLARGCWGAKGTSRGGEGSHPPPGVTESRGQGMFILWERLEVRSAFPSKQTCLPREMNCGPCLDGAGGRPGQCFTAQEGGSRLLWGLRSTCTQLPLHSKGGGNVWLAAGSQQHMEVTLHRLRGALCQTV